MDRRLLGRMARTAFHPASPGDAASLLPPGDGEFGSDPRRGFAAFAPDCAARDRTIATQPTERATGSARLKPAVAHLLYPTEPTRLEAPRPTHRNARRHQTP